MKKFLELLFLKQLKGIGNVTINKKYIQRLLSMDSIEECIALVQELETKLSIEDIKIAHNSALKKYEVLCADTSISVITIFDEQYPKRLHDLKDKKPVIVYAKGDISILEKPSIAIVGTREPSLWSQKVEHQLVQKIVSLDQRVIVSGLALGCDKIAHEATVERQAKTLAILPSGVQSIYPPTHKKLAEDIIKNGGCLLSEYEPDMKPTKSSYVDRDAVIAAISDATFVIECGMKSGTMHTVDAAFKMRRPVACYYTAESGKGKYDGNEFMLDQKGAVKVSDTEELVDFLKLLNK